MAQSHSPRHRARHGASDSRILVRDLAAVLRPLGARSGSVVAKATAVTASGALALSLVLPGETAAATSGDAPVVDDYIAVGSAPIALVSARGEQAASRSGMRAPAALAAPVASAAVAPPSFGEIDVTAVEKPPPPPPPQAATSAASSTASGSSSSGSAAAPAQSSGGGYDWGAASSCACARGLTQNSMKVLAAVKASFPGMTSIGGVRADSLPDHPSGRALDFMTTNRGYGDSIANLLISRAGELNIEYIIWYQRIWMPGKGWRAMSNRGSMTANHMDHVHVTVR